MSWLLQGYKLNESYKHPKLLYLDDVLVYVEAMKIDKGDSLSLYLINNTMLLSITKTDGK